MTVITNMRPGLLVGLKTSIRGNVSYVTRDVEREHQVGEGETRAKWETERTVRNKAELGRATKARAEARWEIAKVCARSSFGLLCPDAWEASLRLGITKAREIVDAFNAKSKVTELQVYVIVGRIAQDDTEAVRAINSEVRDLMRDMQVGLKSLDVKAVRDAANRMRAVGGMLTPEALEKVKVAVEAARGAARKIAKAGEEAAVEIDKEAIKKITAARTAFLDLDESSVIPSAPPKTEARAIDLEPEAKEAPRPKRKAKQAEIDLDPNADAGGDAAEARANASLKRASKKKAKAKTARKAGRQAELPL